jgi:hypothetical protein
VRSIVKILCCLGTLFLLSNLVSCKKDKLNKDPGALVQFSQDSVLFDTVFTTIGSATQNIRVRNTGKQRIKISSIYLEGGNSSPFIINVDGAKGNSFSDIEIAGNDSMYIFVQVNVNPTNANSPMIISDAIVFHVNGNEQRVVLEAWGQDAYYHKPNDAIYFKDGSYLAYSFVNLLTESYTFDGNEYIWKNDKPHVIYGYLVVDSAQKLKIPDGTQVFLNYKAGIWVYTEGQIQVLGKKGREVIFQGARREKDFADEPGQWDRIWINEGSKDNIIDYAIIKNGYVGVQTEYFSSKDSLDFHLTLKNTKIQNMSLWGLYSLFYSISGENNVISNCQEHSVNILLGGFYAFKHCTFANYWSKDKPRDKPAVNINNYIENTVGPLYTYFGNCIIDGKLENELNLDLKPGSGSVPSYTNTFSNNWLKTNIDISNPTSFINNVKGKKDDVLKYKDIVAYNFEPASDETRIRNFTHPNATLDAMAVPLDINQKARNTSEITVGAYEAP